MKKSKKAFSIIEVVTASLILSIAVFWVFKLISENEKIINNSSNYNTANSLFLSFWECLNNIKPNISENKYLNLNNCNSSTSQTWITINNIYYNLSYSWIINNKFILNISNNEINLNQEYFFKN